MPLSDQQAAFIKSYVANEVALAKLREERLKELEALKPARPDTTKIEKMLQDTGRAEKSGPGGAPDTTRAERKEAHLRDVLLRDEDGGNVQVIADKLAPVPQGKRKLARLASGAALAEYAEGAPPPDVRAELPANFDTMSKTEKIAALTTARDAAQADMMRARAAQDFVAQSLGADVTARLPATYATMTPDEQAKAMRDAKNAALEALSNAAHANLSHHASRHGPQTTTEEQVTRAATGYSPDHPDTSVATKTTYTLATGETVDIPDSRSKGPTAANSASFFASGEMELFVLEDALAKAHFAAMMKGLDPGQSIAVTRLGGADDAVVGGSAEVSRNAGGNNVKVDGVTQLQSPNQLNNAAADKAQVLRDRVESIRVRKDIKHSKVATELTSDGGFRTITAYPEAGAAAAGATKRVAGVDTAVDFDAVEAAANAAQLNKAQDKADSSKAAATAQASRTAAAETAFGDAIRSLVTDMSAKPGAEAEMKALQAAARANAAAQASVAALTQADAEAKQSKQRNEQAVATLTAQIGGLKAAFDAAETAVQAGPAPTQPVVQAFHQARDAYQKALDAKARAEGAVTLANAQIAKLGQSLADAQSASAKAAGAQAQAFAAAEAKTSTADAQKIVDGAKAVEATKAEWERARKTLEQARAAEAVAAAALEEVKERQASAAEPDESELTAVERTALAAERQQDIDDETAARRQVLADALAKGPDDLAKAKAAWEEEIATAEAIAAADKRMRDGDRDRLADKRDAMAKERQRLESALAKAEKALAAEGGANAEAAKEIAELQEGYDKAAAEFSLLRKQTAAAKSRAVQRDKIEAAEFALARARVEKLAAEVEAQAAASAGAGTAKAALKLQHCEAAEAVCMLEEGHAMLVAEARESRRDAAVKKLQLDELDARIATLTKQVADATALLPPGGDLGAEDKKLRDQTIPALNATRTKAAGRQKAQQDKTAALEGEINSMANDLQGARKDLKAAADALAHAS